MKSGQIFWGTFFVSLGALILLSKYDVVCIDWWFIWDFWPILLIIWGLAIITKNTIIKPFVVLLSGMVVAILIFGFLSNIFDPFDFTSDDYHDYHSKTFVSEYDSSIDIVKLDLLAGAGTFSIKRNTSNLVKVISRGNIDDYYFNTSANENTAHVEIEMEQPYLPWIGKDASNKLDIELNQNPIWSIDATIGAAKSHFDLSEFKVSNLKLKTGATGTKIKFGNKYDEVDVDIEMGAASLELLIPQTSGCRISGEMVFVAKELPGFEKTKSDGYITSNYYSADEKINIRVDGGVSSLRVHFYTEHD